jgi:predicted DNA binding CopG/RHH family protein
MRRLQYLNFLCHSMEALKVPVFASESEEADWWFDNREMVADLFEKAAAEGCLGYRTAIQVSKADLVRAKVLAKRRGLRYQTYLKMLIHEALEREEKQAS